MLAGDAPYAISFTNTSECSGTITNLLYVVDTVTDFDDIIRSSVDSKSHAVDQNEVLYTVCFPVLHSNYSNYQRLIESLEVNRMFGAQRFVIYNLSSSYDIDMVLGSYERDGIIEIVQWTSFPVTEVHYYGQLAAVNDCLYRNLHRSTFILFADVDEIVVPRDGDWSTSGNSWTDMIERTTHSWLANHGSEGIHHFPGAYMVRNVFFWTNNKKLRGNFSGFEDWLSRSEVPIESQVTVRRENDIWRHSLRSKYFAWSKALVMSGIHTPYEFIDDRVETVYIDEEKGLLQHYRTMDGDFTGPPEVVTDRWMEQYGGYIARRVHERRLTLLDILRKTNSK